MSEMIERVARAIAIAHGDAWDDVPNSKSEWHGRRGQFGNRFRGIDENFKDDYRDEARAAIETMREPTLEMLDSAGEIDDSKLLAMRIWRAMIDAALGKPE